MRFEIQPDIKKTFAKQRFITKFHIIGVRKNKPIIIIPPDKIRDVNKNNGQIEF